jgi:ABC-2 type transport system permease protein
VVLSLPLFASYGFAKHAPVWFYPTAFLLGLPFLVIPAAIGAMLTMVLSAYLPARKARIYSLALLAASLGVTAVVVKMMGLRSMVMQDDDFTQIMRLLNAGTIPILPNTWLARGVQAASEARYGEAGYWFLCLLSTALVSVQACLWMVPPLYYRGWSLAKECASPTLVTGRRSLFPLLDNLFRPFSPPVRALLAKDMRTFWRDPAQWSQLIILFGLLVIYIANIRGLSRQLRGIEFFLKQWPIVLSFFNMGATCFVLSILTTRFIFPMLSLEGKQYWVIGLAPFPKQRLVWQKYCLCLAGCIVIAISLIFFSNTVLNVTPVMAWLGLATVFVMGFGLTSLAVGLGAMYPSFKEDNPARIANGLGGTMAIVASLFYISATIALEIPPAFHLANHSAAGIATPGGLAGALLPMWHYFAGLVLLNAVVIVLPMWLGVRNWLRLEFHL